MATAYTGAQYSANASPRHIVATGVQHETGTFALSAALVINDTIKMFKIPKGARVISVEVDLCPVDNTATPLIIVDVGDSTSATHFGSFTAAQAKTGYRLKDIIVGNLLYTYAADDYLVLTVSTGPGVTPLSTGTIRAAMTYVFDY